MRHVKIRERAHLVRSPLIFFWRRWRLPVYKQRGFIRPMGYIRVKLKIARYSQSLRLRQNSVANSSCQATCAEVNLLLLPIRQSHGVIDVDKHSKILIVHELNWDFLL